MEKENNQAESKQALHLGGEASRQEPMRAEDLQVGDYFYNIERENDIPLCEVLRIDGSNQVEYATCKYLASLFQRERGMARTKVGPKVNYIKMTLVPITEDWFKANPKIFHPSEAIQPPQKKYNEHMPYDGMRMIFQYSFRAKKFPQEYYLVGFKVHYTDEATYQKLRQEGISHFWSEKQSQGYAIIAQIVVPPNGLNRMAMGAMQCNDINDVRHFLHLCGIYDEWNVPEELLD